MLEYADKKLINLYQQIKYKSKWQSLPLNDKLEVIVALNKAFKSLREMDRSEEVDAFTPSIMIDHISQRGFRRTRRLLDFTKKVEEEILEMNLSSDKGRRRSLLELRSKIRHEES